MLCPYISAQKACFNKQTVHVVLEDGLHQSHIYPHTCGMLMEVVNLVGSLHGDEGLLVSGYGIVFLQSAHSLYFDRPILAWHAVIYEDHLKELLTTLQLHFHQLKRSSSVVTSQELDVKLLEQTRYGNSVERAVIADQN